MKKYREIRWPPQAPDFKDKFERSEYQEYKAAAGREQEVVRRIEAIPGTSPHPVLLRMLRQSPQSRA
jgi:DnaJ-domain-containing protein 1